MKSKHDKYWRVIHLLRIVLPGSRKREQARGDEFIAFIHPTQGAGPARPGKESHEDARMAHEGCAAGHEGASGLIDPGGL